MANFEGKYICFSGFGKADKADLSMLAKESGFFVTQGVYNTVDYLVAAYDDGQSKVEAARKCGVLIITRDEFQKMTGASPAEPEKAFTINASINLGSGKFVALDFETADAKRDSACAIGLISIENNVVTHEVYKLIRPPRKEVVNTFIHGLTWEMLCEQPTFCEIWNELSSFVNGADYIIAHNAPFEKSVISACCGAVAMKPPSASFLCTLRGAKSLLTANSYSLPTLCRLLSIPLAHHNALSDAKAAVKLCEHLISRQSDTSFMHVKPIEKKEEKAPLKKKIKKLTKKDIEAIEEFKVIAQALTCDAALTTGEFTFLCDWLTRHKELEDSEDLKSIFELAWLTLEDGVVTDEERNAMLELLNAPS